MKFLAAGLVAIASVLSSGLLARAEIKVVVEHNDNDSATSSFSFKTIPPLAPAHAGTRAQIVLLDGEQDENGAGPEALMDGRLPEGQDEPSGNFFFRSGSDGGRLLLDLRGRTDVKEVNTFSWHPGTRGPQVYTLYGLEDAGQNRNERPPKSTDPTTVGWKVLAKVDARPANGPVGGQYGVRIFDPESPLGRFHYLLFDVLPTEKSDAFGNTFFSEIEVVDADGKRVQGSLGGEGCSEVLDIGEGSYQITLDTCDTPDLTGWSRTNLAPVIREWYPRLVKLLPSEGYVAPTNVSVRFSETYRGVAATSGNRIQCAAKWFRANLQGEAIGSVVHELVHVVQEYGRARRENPEATRSPGWLVEGLADYIRWFLYEPQSHGADLVWMKQRKNLQLRHDAGYRVTANFLDWVTRKYDKDIIPQLNAAMRAGKYRESIWKERAGHTLEELGAEWKQGVEAELTPGTAPPKQ